MAIVRTQRLRKGIRLPAKGKDSAYVQALEKNHEDLELQHQSLLQAQMELELSRDHYVELFDSAPVCFVTLTLTGVIREINLPGVQLLSPRQHRVTGLPFIGFLAEGERKSFLTHLRLCRDNPDPTRTITAELQLAHKPDEKPVFIELVSVPSKENDPRKAVFKSVFRDISEIKEMQEVHRWLAAIVESSNDAIIGRDMDGRIISCNRGTEQLFGYTCAEMMGKPTTLLVPPGLLKEELRILGRLRQGEKTEHYETLRRRKDGTFMPVSLTISPIFDARAKSSGIPISSMIFPNGKRVKENWEKA